MRNGQIHHYNNFVNIFVNRNVKFNKYILEHILLLVMNKLIKANVIGNIKHFFVCLLFIRLTCKSKRLYAYIYYIYMK